MSDVIITIALWIFMILLFLLPLFGVIFSSKKTKDQ